jgi:hypothetical protein
MLKFILQHLLLFILILVENIFLLFLFNKINLGYLLRVPIKRIQKCILETLFKSIQASNKSPLASDDYDGLKPTTIDYLIRTQCNSDLCETLVKVTNEILNLLKLIFIV